MELQESLELLKTGQVIISETGDSIIELSGIDALDWLQGQITQDMNLLSKGSQISSCICFPTGQLLTLTHIYLRNDRILIVTRNPDVVFNLIENFVIMEDVSFKVLPGKLFSIQGTGSSVSGDFELPRDRTGFGGFDILNPTGNFVQLHVLPDLHLQALEIAAGIPRLGVDTSSKTLPPELGDQFESEFINYNKGCYAGQEVLQRIHSRGHTNKTWVGLRADHEMTPGSDVRYDGQIVGTVHRSAQHPDLGFIGTATLKNVATEPGTVIEVGGIAATVQHFPLS